MRRRKRIVLYACLMVYVVALACVLVALSPPSVLAFYVTHSHQHRHNHDETPSHMRRIESSLLHTKKPIDGYSSMPPLLNYTTESYSSRGNIFKIFKRDVYPTVDLPYENNYTMIDHYFMGLALHQAKVSWKKGEVPIGAIIVRECADDNIQSDTTKRTFQILSAAHNRVENNNDASAHAELLALRNGAQNLGNWRYPSNSRLYSTLEPCPMCLASIQAFRIDHIIYGAPDNRLGAIKTHMDLINAAQHPYHEVKSVTGGVREEECGNIMVQFFRERRQKKKEMKGGRNLLKLPLKSGPVDTNKQSRFKRFVKKMFRRD